MPLFDEPPVERVLVTEPVEHHHRAGIDQQLGELPAVVEEPFPGRGVDFSNAGSRQRRPVV